METAQRARYSFEEGADRVTDTLERMTNEDRADLFYVLVGSWAEARIELAKWDRRLPPELRSVVALPR